MCSTDVLDLSLMSLVRITAGVLNLWPLDFKPCTLLLDHGVVSMTIEMDVQIYCISGHKNYTKKENSKMGFYHLFFCFKDILHIKVQEFNVISWFKLKSSSFSQLSAQFSIYGSFLI